MEWKNITVAGSGTLGSQIAFQIAYKGYEVSIYDINDAVLEKAKARIQHLKEIYRDEIINYGDQVDHIEIEKTSILPAVQDVWEREKENLLTWLEGIDTHFSYHSDLKEAVADADLIIEAIPEVPAIKTDFYKNLSQVAPEKTIFASNSSTLLPSQFADTTGRPEKFLALHFANQIWKNNTAEIMGTAKTDPQNYKDVVAFAKSIGMITIEIQKEQSGYVLNSILVPFLNSALKLYFDGIATPETIDKTWMVATGSPMGPFGIFDMVGMTTVYNILAISADETLQQLAKAVKAEFIDTNRLGISTGGAFYSYPNPAFQQKGFIEN